MLNSLRNRLIISHILPLMIIIPFMGIVLIYVLETQYLLPKLSNDLIGFANLLTDITKDQERLWNDPAYAENVLEQIRPELATRVMFLTPDGRLLASSDPVDASRLNEPLNIPDLSQVQGGDVVNHTTFSQRFKGEVIDILEPVVGSDNQLKGIIRLSYHFDTVSEDFLKLRYYILGILVFGIVLGTLLGYVLALNIASPVQKVTQAMVDLARGDRRESLPEQGPEEIRLLLRGVNFLVQRLHNLETARRQLLANLVHELGRPLGAMRMGLQALMRGAKEDPQLMDELIEGMDEEASRLQYLLDDLAHLHDQVLGALELDRKPVELSKWLPKVLTPWQEAARRKHLKWQVEVPEDLPTIKVDPIRIGQVIGNLISNAIKYTPMRGTVTVTAGVDEDDAWVRVNDTGPGISLEDQDKIFTPFYRGRQGKRIVQGMGLGLSITRDLVQAHGGRLEFESTPGLGSQFIVYIPRREQSPIPKTLTPQPQSS
jgi:two-component system sensor histidine kinase BaeS